jgi:DNA-3-methyladenine glycosylase I
MTTIAPKKLVRCGWCLKDDIYMHYHDTVWGVAERDDQKLFAKLCLDGAQAGLSWYTVLVRTEGYARAFDGWDAEKIARYTPKKIQELMQDPGIIRNRQKIESVVRNARAYLAIMDQGDGSFRDMLWKHVHHQPLVNHWTEMAQVPARSAESDALSKELRKAGFSFVGSTIVYAFMQACGLVNDHLLSCWRRQAQRAQSAHG